MNLTTEQAAFLLKAIATAYDTVSIYEIFEDEFDSDIMEDAMAKLRNKVNAGSK